MLRWRWFTGHCSVSTKEETVFVPFTSSDSHNLTFSPSPFPPDSIIENIYCIKVPMSSTGPLPLLQIHKSHVPVHVRSGPMVSYMSEWKIYAWWYPHIPRSKQITFTLSISQLVYWPYFSTCTITIYDCEIANTLLFLELHWLCNRYSQKCIQMQVPLMLTILQVQNWPSRKVGMVTLSFSLSFFSFSFFFFFFFK